ncbi:MAG: FG-GAP repeat protein [Proteobacteria bacterium]|nr:FG-GAP repeat protein [Pseudomonadota bacterium]
MVFGKASGFAANLDASSLDGSNGFALSGPADSYAGFDVRAAGDINGDGFADLVIGAYGDDANGTGFPARPSWYPARPAVSRLT